MSSRSVTLESLVDEYSHLLDVEKSNNWKRGDMCIKLLDLFGDAAKTDFCKKTGEALTTFNQLVWVARAYPACSRNYSVTWTHYRMVAAQPDRFVLLHKAAREKWSVKRLEQEIRPQLAQPSYCANCGNSWNTDQHTTNLHKSKYTHFCSLTCLVEHFVGMTPYELVRRD